LKTNQTLPVGKKVKCPNCGAPFTIGSDQVSAAPPAPATSPVYPGSPPAARANGQSSQAITPGARPAYSPPPLGGEPLAPAAGKSNTMLIALVAAGSLVVVGGGIALAIVLLSGGNSSSGRDNGKDVAKDKKKDDDEVFDPNKKEETPRDKKKDKGKDKDKKKGKRKGPGRPALPNKEQARVNEAVKKGMAYMKSAQQADGSWAPPFQDTRLQGFKVGYTALPGLTLLECGVDKKDPAIQKAADWLRTNAPNNGRRFRGVADPQQLTYDLSLAILFLDRLGDPKDKPLIQKLALCLVAGQTRTGGWTYYCRVLSDSEQQQLHSLLKKQAPLTSDLDLKQVDVNKLVTDPKALSPALKNLAIWQNDTVTNPPNRGTGESDNSNTQFAILALLVAQKYDLPLHRTLALIVKRFRKGQNQDGSWGYLVNGPEMIHQGMPPTMTCAGLLGLAVGLGLANEAKAKEGDGGKGKNAADDPKVKLALEKILAPRIGEAGKPWRDKVALIDMYFLWSVERVGVIYGLRKIGGKDWYAWGAEMLVTNQTAQGNWEKGGYSNSTPVIDTCFALLFLKRANLAKELKAKLQVAD
jgi:hypothetical protein